MEIAAFIWSLEWDLNEEPGKVSVTLNIKFFGFLYSFI